MSDRGLQVIGDHLGGEVVVHPVHRVGRVSGDALGKLHGAAARAEHGAVVAEDVRAGGLLGHGDEGGAVPGPVPAHGAVAVEAVVLGVGEHGVHRPVTHSLRSFRLLFPAA